MKHLLTASRDFFAVNRICPRPSSCSVRSQSGLVTVTTPAISHLNSSSGSTSTRSRIGSATGSTSTRLGSAIRLLVLFYLLPFTGCSTKYRLSDDQFSSRKELIITTVLIEPYVMITKSSEDQEPPSILGSTSEPTYEGYMVDLVDKISKIVDFRYKLIPAVDGHFGYKKEDGSWNGIIGEIMRKEADIAAGPTVITRMRKQVVDFTRPFITMEATVVISKSTHMSNQYATTVRDIVEGTDLNMGTLNRGVIHRALRKSNDTVFRQMFETMSKLQGQAGFTKTNDEGIALVRTSNYAFVMPSEIAAYVAGRKPCDLVTIDRFLVKEGLSLAVEKGSYLLPYLNRAISFLRMNGELDALYKKWWVDRSQCVQVGGSSLQASNDYQERVVVSRAAAAGSAADAKKTRQSSWNFMSTKSRAASRRAHIFHEYCVITIVLLLSADVLSCRT